MPTFLLRLSRSDGGDIQSVVRGRLPNWQKSHFGNSEVTTRFSRVRNFLSPVEIYMDSILRFWRSIDTPRREVSLPDSILRLGRSVNTCAAGAATAYLSSVKRGPSRTA